MVCVSAEFNNYQKFQVVDGLQTWSRKDGLLCIFDGKKGQLINNSIHKIGDEGGWGGGRTGLMVRASDSGSGDPGSILGRVGVFVSLSKRHLLPKSTGNTQE